LLTEGVSERASDILLIADVDNTDMGWPHELSLPEKVRILAHLKNTRANRFSELRLRESQNGGFMAQR